MNNLKNKIRQTIKLITKMNKKKDRLNKMTLMIKSYYEVNMSNK